VVWGINQFFVFKILILREIQYQALLPYVSPRAGTRQYSKNKQSNKVVPHKMGMRRLLRRRMGWLGSLADGE
jgi:hypothetical protein